MNQQEALLLAENADIVTFDVFDTLITRMVLHPADVFSLVSLLKTEELNLGFDFRDARIKAERELYKSGNSYCNINDIYDSLGKIYGLSNDKLDTLKNAELFSEEKLVCPREDVKSFVLKLYESGKKIVFVSDMYLSSLQIKRLLEICGYPDEIELIVSNELKKSKSDGSLWEYFFNIHSDKKTLHFGDSKHGDYDMVKKFNRDAVLLDNPADRFISSEMYGNLCDYDNGEFGNSLLLGKLCNVILYNNTFSDEFNQKSLTGLWLGSVLSCFMRWLINTRDDSLLLFVTREGYILRPMYLEYCKAAGVEPQKNCLFYASRKATVAASIKDAKDVEDSLDMAYVDGNIGSLLESRLGVSIDDDETTGTIITLPRDKHKVMSKIRPFLDSIISQCVIKGYVYRDYVDECRAGSGNVPLTIVDIGYSGSTQYYLSKVLGERVSGKYLMTNPNPYPQKIGCSIQSMCSTSDSIHPVYDNHMFFEAAMQVPYGQLQEIKKDVYGNFVFKCNNSKQTSKEIALAQEASIDFAAEDAVWYGLLGNRFDYSLAIAEKIWICLAYFNFLPSSILNNLKIDEDFFGKNEWKYDAERKALFFGEINVPLVFFDKKSPGINKLQLKNFVKRHVPSILYEPFRIFWIKHIK